MSTYRHKYGQKTGVISGYGELVNGTIDLPDDMVVDSPLLERVEATITPQTQTVPTPTPTPSPDPATVAPTPAAQTPSASATPAPETPTNNQETL